MKKRILIIVNHEIVIYNFRKELVEKLLDEKFKVIIASPEGKKIDYFKESGCEHIIIDVDRRGNNPFTDVKLFLKYIMAIRSSKPDVVLTYTIKPNIYGGLASRLTGTNIIHTVTGLGSVFIQERKLKNVILKLNKIAFKNSKSVFFLNQENRDTYRENKVISFDQKTEIVAGSGVNLDSFAFSKMKKTDVIVFSFIARILKDKGIEEYLIAAAQIKEKFPKTVFNVAGFVEEEKYRLMLKEYTNDKVINYLGEVKEIIQVMNSSHCIVLPSYGEGRGTVLQEGAAIGRPLITCDTYGCRENVDDGVNGYLCDVGSSESLYIAMKKFINLNFEQKEIMGKKSRIKAEREFSRSLVVETYMNEIKYKES